MSIPRRGWRETVEPGIYRAHRLACDSSADHKRGRRCGCPWQIKVPGLRVGTTRTVTVVGSLTEARTERRRFMAEGRPAAPPEPIWAGSLDDFTRSYFQAKAPVLAPSTIRARDEAYRANIAPFLGRLDIADVTRERVEVWLARLAANDSRHAVWKAVSALRAILKVAVEWSVMAANPAAGLRLPRPEVERTAPPERVLDEGQLAALFAAVGHNARLETMFRMAGEAGFRRGEILGLRWPDLDLSSRRVTIARAIWQECGHNGGGPTKIVRTPKSGKTRRVAMSESLAARLADWYAEAVIEGGAPAEGYVWPGRDGGPMDDGTPLQALGRALAKAKLLDAAGKPLVTFHGLRHTAGSIMLAQGAPLIAVSRQLGHSNPNITASVYAHLVNEDRQLDEAMSVFDRLPSARTVRGAVRGEGMESETLIARGTSGKGPAVF